MLAILTPMRLLLLDTCGDNGSLALAESGEVVRERMLLPRAASAQLVGAIRDELRALGWPLRTLDAVCVVSGPGSFTGVRVGLAAAKGMCEVAGLALVTLSRLEVLLHASCGTKDVAVLDAGRGEFYVRSAEQDERLLGHEQLLELAAGRRVVVAEDKLLRPLQALQPTLVPLSAAHALPLSGIRIRQGSDNVDSADANYVRNARALYAGGGAASNAQ